MTNDMQVGMEGFEEIDGTAEKLRKERECKQKKVDIDKKIADLAEKTVDFIMDYGKEDFRSELMMSFLDVALEMRETIEMMSAINIAMSCIFSTIEFIDEAINFDQELQEASLNNKYGFFARLKNKRRLKKVIKNNQNRINVAIDNILGQKQMAEYISESLRKAVMKMKISIGKQNEKRAKQAAKKNLPSKGTTAFGGESKASKLIEEIMKRRMGDDYAKSAPSAAASGSGDVDNSDVY